MSPVDKRNRTRRVIYFMRRTGVGSPRILPTRGSTVVAALIRRGACGSRVEWVMITLVYRPVPRRKHLRDRYLVWAEQSTELGHNPGNEGLRVKKSRCQTYPGK